MAELTKSLLNKRETIKKQWTEFSKTEAYEEYMKYLELQGYLAVAGAKGGIDQFESGQFDPYASSAILQRGVGIDIAKEFIEGIINN